MQLNQIFFIILLLMNGILAIRRHEDDGKMGGLASASASASRDSRKVNNAEQSSRKQLKLNSNYSNDEEDKKTLAEQVADGKYGLIQRELFSETVKRPGIISYEVNPEVPKDNVNNLGGLMADEIWLAENHLLVLKGASLGGEGKWPAIDNYVAPRRQVKIPLNPKVPPPFPVQLADGAPTKFIKARNESSNRNETYPGNLKLGSGYQPFPFLLPLAPAIPPFLANLTELDEDDPTIYYPPPYDFVYPKDNSSFVAAGPLVPGIVVPPPPNFFSQLNQHKQLLNKTKTRQQLKTPITRTSTTTTSTTTTTTTTTIAPIAKITTIKITTSYKTKAAKSQSSTISPNDISNSLPANTPVGDWIPIPAPRPFYISLKPYISNIEETATAGVQQAPAPAWKLVNKTESKNNQYFNEFIYKPIYEKSANPLFIENYSEKSNYRSIFDNERANEQYETNTLAPLTQPQIKSTNQYLSSPLEYFFNKKFNLNNKYETTRKPPVYEYSYSAPGYGSVQAPKIGAHFFDIPTEKPYDTKSNYFELFGRKLNEEFTTALPNINYRSTGDRLSRQQAIHSYNPYYSYTSTIKPKSYKNLYRNVKPLDEYRDSAATSISLHSDIRVNYKQPLAALNPDAEYLPHSIYSTPSPHHLYHSYSNSHIQPYADYNVQQYSHSQTTPSPRIPQTGQSSFISYQLPGTNGHFYFLTPQAVK